ALDQPPQHEVAVGLEHHVDEVDDDDAADVAQPQLTHDLLGGFEVVLRDGLLEGPAGATTSNPPRRSCVSCGCATSAASTSSTSSTWCSSPTATSCCGGWSSAWAATAPSTRSPRSPRWVWCR